MKIEDIRIMRGPNKWSNYRRQLIVMKLDIGELEDVPTNKLDGFADRLNALMPSLHEHRCSEDHPGGFLKRVKEGTWIGHVIEHIALELQTLAGMDCGFGRTRSAGVPGLYYVIFSYEVENAGVYAGKAAVRVAEAVTRNEPYAVEDDIAALKTIFKNESLGPTTQAIVDEAAKRGIPYKRLDRGSFVQLGYGKNQKRVRASMTSTTSCLGVDLAGDKERTKRLLADACIPVANSILVRHEDELDEAIEEVGFPLVTKPVDGNHGRGITTNIRTKEQLAEAFKLAKEISSPVMVEAFVCGFDYRFLVINYKLVAVAKRTPALVIGDGRSTIAQLIREVNEDPARGEGHEKTLTTIKVDKITETILASKNYTLETVIPPGEILFLKNTANLSTGGTSRDVTDLVHPHNVLLAERVARLLNLDICGIDIVAKDVNIPITAETGAVLEVNACPGFRMHLSPSKGLARNVAEPVVDMLFPQGSAARIPIVAITGTNGKTTTTRLVAHLAASAGHKVGFTTTDGIYIRNEMIAQGDCTGPVSADVVLNDATVDFAVLECARGGILRAGLAFEQCDISIITNISEDHLGLDGIQTLDEMVEVKAVVAHSTAKHGYCILNADDDHVYGIRRDLDCNIALFSTRGDNERVRWHCENGGTAAIVENGYLTLCKGNFKTRIGKIANIPLSFSGKSSSMIKNIVPATLAGFLSGFSPEQLRSALATFIPSPAFTPGRMNMFHFKKFDVMLDYAHNAGGFEELKVFLGRHPAPVKIGIVTGVGDRRDEDIRNIGKYAAQLFDEIIIRHDKDLRGRTKEEMTALIMQGIQQADPSVPVSVISDEHEAIRHAMETAPERSLITTLTEDVPGSLAFLDEALKNETKEKEVALNFPLSKAS